MGQRPEDVVRRTGTARYNRVVPVANPAAGADWEVTVPGGVEWRILSALAQLVTSVAAANRVPVLEFDDGSTTFVRLPTDIVIAGSSTAIINWTVGGTTFDVVEGETRLASGLPSLALPSGFRVGPTTDNIQAADQWSGIVLYVVETMTGPSALGQLYQPYEEVP